MKDIVLIGSGGFAKEAAWLIADNNKQKKEWNVLGYISEERPGTRIGGVTVLGNDEWLLTYSGAIAAACCIGDGGLRKKIVDKLRANTGIYFPNLISHRAALSDSVHLGQGCIITASCVLTVDISVGDFLLCNLGATVGHDCRIGDYVTLNPGVRVSGNVKLHNCVTLGTGAGVIQGITIGEGTTVGAGAAVVRDLPAKCVAVGVPAKPIIGR